MILHFIGLNQVIFEDLRFIRLNESDYFLLCALSSDSSCGDVSSIDLIGDQIEFIVVFSEIFLLFVLVLTYFCFLFVTVDYVVVDMIFTFELFNLNNWDRIDNFCIRNQESVGLFKVNIFLIFKTLSRNTIILFNLIQGLLLVLLLSVTFFI